MSGCCDVCFAGNGKWCIAEIGVSRTTYVRIGLSKRTFQYLATDNCNINSIGNNPDNNLGHCNKGLTRICIPEDTKESLCIGTYKALPDSF